MHFLRLVLFFFLVGMVGTAISLEVPRHTGLVIDQTKTLSSDEQRQLEEYLQQFQREYGPQIQVLIIPSLQDETIETYSIKVVDEWKLGNQKKDDGILLLVAKENRKVRIEVGQGLEGNLPDVVAGRIIDQSITPHFREKSFSEGIFEGIQAITKTLEAQQNISEATSPRPAMHFSPFFFFFIIFIVISILNSFARMGRGRSGNGWTSRMGTAAILGSLLGGSGRRGGGGGFSGGGGGGFSGGGASGSW